MFPIPTLSGDNSVIPSNNFLGKYTLKEVLVRKVFRKIITKLIFKFYQLNSTDDSEKSAKLMGNSSKSWNLNNFQVFICCQFVKNFPD